MKFANVVKYFENEIFVSPELRKTEIKGLCYDSRKCAPGFVFFAIKGYKTDGHNYIENAFKKGASVVIANQDTKDKFSNEIFSENMVFVENTRRALALCAKAFYNNPTEKLKVIGVTGTNGKTSITYMIKAALNVAGEKCGVIGTIAYYLGDKKVKAPNTTPESLEIYRIMSEMLEIGCTYCVMEVSSHALFLDRVYGIDFDVAIFTNLSGEHLDFHKDMEDYLNAKLLIFDLLKNSNKKNKCAVVNADSDVSTKVIKRIVKLNLNCLTIGIENSADYKVTEHRSNISINNFKTITPNGEREFSLHLLGDFNVLNALSVIACLDFFNLNRNHIKAGLENVSVPGRFERVDSPLGFTVIIDYAHTDDALENVLKTLRQLNPRRIISVFGCGGDRDTTKRALMGEVSTRFADFTILTSDNPRTEAPEKIIDMIEQGALSSGGEYTRIADREQAIKHAIEIAGQGDIILVAGKGHEDYQILGDKVIHFDDKEITYKYVDN